MTASKQANHTIFWQGSKAVFSVLFVWLYGRLSGVEIRGGVSLLLLNIQIAMMLVEMAIGSALPNMMVQFGFKQVVKAIFPIIMGIIPFWIFSILIMAHFNWLEGFNNPDIWIAYLVLAPLMILLLALLNLQYGFYQTRGWIERRNRIQTLIEFLKITLLLWVFYQTINGESIIQVIVDAGSAPRQSDFSILEILGVLCLATFMGWIISVIFSFKSMISEWKSSASNKSNMGKAGFWESAKAQTGHLLYFLITRLPIWFIVWQYHNYGWVGVLSNVFLMMDTLMIFANSHGVVLHAKTLNDKVENHEISYFVSRSVLLVFIIGIFISIIPASFYTWIFGNGFGDMHSYYLAILPAILFAAFASPIAHKLHAESKFALIIRIYFESLVILVGAWWGCEWVLGTQYLNFGHAFICNHTESGVRDVFPWGIIAMNFSFAWLAFKMWQWGNWRWHFFDDIKSIVYRFANIFRTM